MNKDFAMKIRLNNENLHKAAESTGFNYRLVSGKADKLSYGEFMFNYMAVYKAIENSLDKLSDIDAIKPFVTKELYRSESIKKDLEIILGDKLSSMELLPSTKAYVSRIKEGLDINPILIISHAYTRFLADLFGGRTIHQIVKENYNIENDALNYFNFPEIKDIMEYVMKYRANLSKLELSKADEDAFLNEIANSYIYNIGISTELEAKLYSPKEEGSHGHSGHPGGHPNMPAGHPPINHGHMPTGHPDHIKR